MAFEDHEFTTAGSYDDSTCDRCGKHISKQDESCIAPIEDNDDHYPNDKFRQRIRETTAIEVYKTKEERIAELEQKLKNTASTP